MVALVNTTTLRKVLGITFGELHHKGPGMSSGGEQKMINATAALLRMSFQLSAESANADEKLSWIIVQAFLWTLWQRNLMLSFWCMLGNQLRNGYDFRVRATNIHGLTSISQISAHLSSQELDEKRKAPYMCGWAYQLLRDDRACVTTDLRRFHWCYHGLFGTRPARCKDGQQQCEGGSPLNCQRFRGAVVSDQSAHDSGCDRNCGRLFWDRASFLSVPGAKAVCLTATDDKHVRYCKASDRTLAISHVWSHGQGGRPDTTGFNACLHRRYVKIAKHFKCDSYWMDTPCIPQEHALRAECIDNINKIFIESMVTLVCDRDIMDIDIGNLTLDLKESILATVLVCDWNIRAWTLLEAMRGRQNIHLLCKENEVLCLKDTLQDVNENGRIDLAILFLTTQHLLPAPELDTVDLFDQPLEEIPEEDITLHLGLISLAEASILLSHRHATRDGDNVVIWSLLAREKAIQDVAELWKNQVGYKIHTGFLMSSSPRLRGHPSFGWAPSCPTLQPPPSTESKDRRVYLAYDGNNTQEGLITSEGLRAKWLVHKFLLSSADYDLRFPKNVQIARRYLEGYCWGALLRPGQVPGKRYTPAPYQGKAKTPLLAVCGSHNGQCWEWKGVYEWDVGDPLPDIEPDFRKPEAPPMDFLLEEILLV